MFYGSSHTDKLHRQGRLSDEVAEFSPEVIEEMKMHVAKYPADRSRSALIPLLMLVQRERGWIDNPSVNFLAKFLISRSQTYGRRRRFTRC